MKKQVYIVWKNGGNEGMFESAAKAAAFAKSLIKTDSIKNLGVGSELWQMFSVMIEKVETEENA